MEEKKPSMSTIEVFSLYCGMGIIVSVLHGLLDPGNPDENELALSFMFWPMVIWIAIAETIGKISLKIRKALRKLK